ncbi:MAG: glycoside hydrolase 100 family protein [Flavobacterium sp.]
MSAIYYNNSIALLHTVSTSKGFLASAENTSNYKRVWARDGVICGLAALASGDEKLISTFKNTLETLAKYQHEMGTIPSNVLVSEDQIEVSYGGLAGRVDAITWFIIGVCQYGFFKNDPEFVSKFSDQIEKCLFLLNAWEFNNKHLLYVPQSGNWADEYVTDGYVLYDQLLRIWALKSYNHFVKKVEIDEKINAIIEQISINFFPDSSKEKFHPEAYNSITFKDYAPCSFSPSGYKEQFDAFANALLLLLNIGSTEFQNKLINYSQIVADETKLGLLPAFWPPIFPEDEYWNLLKRNCKYEFRNYPYEFHNGGSWSMVNGFFCMAYREKNEDEKAHLLLENINKANAIKNFSFYENFNTQTQEPNGVAFCAWSAAAGILAHQSVYNNFKFLF